MVAGSRGGIFHSIIPQLDIMARITPAGLRILPVAVCIAIIIVPEVLASAREWLSIFGLVAYAARMVATNLLVSSSIERST